MEAKQSGEAICFTAGPQGGAFGAGVIHAYLVADRDEPRVVAGISMGSITAAAMQRTMKERKPLAGGRDEASRWGWFQRYLEDILDRPLDVIWKGIPDPVDFFSSTAPVKDLSCPEELKPEERAARYQYWQLVKLGQWVAELPVTIGELGKLGMLWVRKEERIPSPLLGHGLLSAAGRTISFAGQAGWIASQVFGKVISKPMWTRTYAQYIHDELNVRDKTIPGKASLHEQQLIDSRGRILRKLRLQLRPIFGWKVWVLACLVVLIPALVLLIPAIFHRVWWGVGGEVVLLAAVVAVMVRMAKKKTLAERLTELAQRIDPDTGSLEPPTKSGFVEGLKQSALKAVGIDSALVSKYYLKRRIWEGMRFEDGMPLVVEQYPSCNTELVVVASVLQSLPHGKYGDRRRISNQQVFARPGSSLIDALVAACTIPNFFAPEHVSAADAKQKWLRLKDQKDEVLSKCDLDLVDGGSLRKNPLPALFNWLREKPNQDVADALVEKSKNGDASIHVIYSVPIEPFDANNGGPAPDRIDLIEGAQVGILMRARRDTLVEVNQTNFLTEVQKALDTAKAAVKGCAAVADEIGPEREIVFQNPIAPSRAESLKSTAEGCRRTLSRLYSRELDDLMRRTDQASVPCGTLIQLVAPARAGAQFTTGLPQVCEQCTGTLKPYLQPPATPAIVKQDFIGKGSPAVRKELEKLCVAPGKPRIAFVASGGVFKGAFHIGLLGAMQTLKMTPDLVVGASVGTLMGGALASMRNLECEDDQLKLLSQLSDVFLHVDTKVALTTPVKTAAKQIGLRAKGLKLSPEKLRAVVMAGTSKDIGYAATGVPPLVIDTLSELFMIPPRETLKVGSSFLAGKFADSFFQLASLLRKRTLDRLDIRYAVIGTSMLAGVAKLLLAPEGAKYDLNKRQPYLKPGSGTAIFCTTAYVNMRWLLVLGRDALVSNSANSFNFLKAALSSSAFPAAFEPRSEAEVFPGIGQENHLFCDGGTFDNLPFIPTFDLLKATQMAGDEECTPLEALKQRLDAPDLIISAGFDPAPVFRQDSGFDSRSKVMARLDELAAAVKTDSFVAMTGTVAKNLGKLAACYANSGPKDAATEKLMRESVIAGIVSVVPTSELHVNPTFGFARSVGLEPERVAVSIGDGCFQTLLTLHQRGDSLVAASLKALNVEVKLRDGDPKKYKGTECPFFEVACAFQQASEKDKDPTRADGCRSIFKGCSTDPCHIKLIQIERKKPEPGTGTRPLASAASA